MSKWKDSTDGYGYYWLKHPCGIMYLCALSKAMLDTGEEQIIRDVLVTFGTDVWEYPENMDEGCKWLKVKVPK